MAIFSDPAEDGAALTGVKMVVVDVEPGTHARRRGP